jgi:hypothetical protein
VLRSLAVDAIDLKPQQHVGFDHVDLVATLHWRAGAVARGAIADRPWLTTTERIGVGAEVAALELLNQRDRAGEVGLLSVLAPCREPCAIARIAAA